MKKGRLLLICISVAVFCLAAWFIVDYGKTVVPKYTSQLRPVINAVLSRGAATVNGMGFEIKPINVTSNAVTSAHMTKVHVTWWQKAIVQPFRKRVANQPWSAAVVPFVENGVQCCLGMATFTNCDARLEEGSRLMLQGCRDPLLIYVMAAYQAQTEQNEKARSLLLEVAAELEKDQTIPRGLGLVAYGWFDELASKQPLQKLATPQKLAAWVEQAMKDGTYDSEDAEIFVYHQCYTQWHSLGESQPAVLAPVYAKSPMPEWVRATLAGYIEVEKAWKIRGTGWANSVSEQQWAGFAKHLAEAKKQLTTAWRLHPTRPEAATKMITVIMGDNSGGLEEMRLWFDRAIAAEFDYIPAYNLFIWAMRPRWGGSQELMLEFGKACAATRRFDTDIPLMFNKVCMDIVSELPDWRPFVRQPEIAAQYVDLYQSFVQAPLRPGYTRASAYSIMAIRMWMVGKYALAVKALEEAGGKLDPGMATRLASLQCSEAQFMAEIAMHASGRFQDLQQADLAYEGGDLNKAASLYEALLPTVAETAKASILAQLALVRMEQSLGKGEWVQLAFDQLDQHWIKRSGCWEYSPPDSLLKRGDNAHGVCVHKARVGPNFEMLGEFEISAPQGCCQNMGVVWGWTQVGIEDEFSHCVFSQNEKSQPGFFLYRGMLDREDKSEFIEYKPKNTFHIRCNNGRLMVKLNDTILLNDYKPKKLIPGTADGRVGFGASRFCVHNQLQVRGVKVRRL